MKVQIKLNGDQEFKDTEFTDMQDAIDAVREPYKVFGITHCQLRLKTDKGVQEWDNF